MSEFERLEALCRERAEIIEGIRRVLDGHEWDSQTTSMIANILTDHGYAIREPHEIDESGPQGQGVPQPIKKSELKLLAYAYADSQLVQEGIEDRDSAIEKEVNGDGGAIEQLESAYITKFSNYITGGPGYAGTVYVIVWDGAPAFVSVGYWSKNRIKMVHYGND